ncbi:hypothetical protein J7382_11685 [Shimia sp. R11_0]|uniref:hypothetical protein n=1 Tax=Shimia sp. R11_0 TaxID=2821096 RepID=UPI001ADC44C4|nr:hypothetical protein [Shimia sp. R11_0]MBO9478197.1 hypothetical protein [Shimia sp. R11_0]
MTQNFSDVELAQNHALQKKIIDEAYATGDEKLIEQAIIQVASVHRLKKSGMLEWLLPNEDE